MDLRRLVRSRLGAGIFATMMVGLVCAATFGPLMIAPYFKGAASLDETNEWLGANGATKLLVSLPGSRAKAGDSFRWQYSDGTIVQFTFNGAKYGSWCLIFDKVVKTGVQGNMNLGSAANIGGGMVSVSTGYWGNNNSFDDETGTIVVDTVWISTGTTTISTAGLTAMLRSQTR